MTVITVGILTVSDSCHLKQKEDVSGRKLSETVQNAFPNYKIIEQAIVPDDKPIIQSILRQWISIPCNLILTTGGTGFGPRDITPEATRTVIEREAPGLACAMITKSLNITPMAVLSRPVCGIKNKSIIINLPGSAKGAVECLSFIQSALPHALDLVVGNDEIVAKQHVEIQTGSIQHFTPSNIKSVPIADRSRKSPYPLISVEEAKQLIFQHCSAEIESEIIPIELALGRILSEDVYSKDPVPPFDASIKDGYAVIAADGAGIRKVINFCAAGGQPIQVPIKTGEAIRICTGAPIPLGADAVVQVEDTELIKATDDGGEEIEIVIKTTPTLMQDIRKIGTDIRENTKIFDHHQRISSAHIGVLAAIGKAAVSVFKKPVIGVLSTGNELVDYKIAPKLGQIRDSNRLTLKNLLKEHRYVCKDFGIIKDVPDDVKAKIANAFIQCDIVMTSGGVSMGEFDLIKQVLISDFNACIHFGRVNMKPGKPTTFATLNLNGKRKIFFGLPGNPVSAGVTCLLFVIPLLKHLERYPNPEFPMISGNLNQAMMNKDDRPEYARVTIKQINENMQIYSTGDQISSRLNSLSSANGLLLVSGKTTLQAGTLQKVMLINEIL